MQTLYKHPLCPVTTVKKILVWKNKHVSKSHSSSQILGWRFRQARDTGGIESHLKRVQILKNVSITERNSELFDTVPGAGPIMIGTQSGLMPKMDLRMMGFGTAECHFSFASLPATLCNIFSQAKFIFCNDCNFCI